MLLGIAGFAHFYMPAMAHPVIDYSRYFAAVIRLLFLSSRKIEVIVPLPLLPEPVKEATEKDVQVLAYSVILRRVTELVLSEYPEARWIWEAPNAERLIRENQEVFILLNRAGGYRRAGS